MKKTKNTNWCIIRSTILLTSILLIQDIQFSVGLEFATPQCRASIDKKCSTDKTQILTCNSFGDGYDLTQTCATDEECGFESGTVKCIKKQKALQIENIPFFPLLSLILAIIIVILWYLLVKNSLNKNKEMRKHK